MWGYLENSVAWFSVDKQVKEFLSNKNIEIKDKFQGMASIYEYLEKDEEATSALRQFIKDNVLEK